MNQRQLILWRHAKSDWHARYATDHDRPLNERGLAARHRMAAYIQENFSPELIVCSTATRTRETLNALDCSAPIEFDEALYHAMPATIAALVRQYGADCQTLLVVGHNPGLEMLAANTGGTKRAMQKRIAEKFPTAAVACLQFSGSWKNFAAVEAAVTAFETPKSLTPDMKDETA